MIIVNNDKLVIKAKRPKGDDGYKTFSVRIREETVAEIDKVAARTNRSRNELVGIFLDFALERCTIEAPPSKD